MRWHLRRGGSASEIAIALQNEGLGNIELLLVFREATGSALGDLKALGQWWSENGVTDVEAFDRRAREVFERSPSEEKAALVPAPRVILDEWWLMDCALPSLSWARLREFESGSAEVFDCDGATHVFERAAQARNWLREDEYEPLLDLGPADLAVHGLRPDQLIPPSGRANKRTLPAMLEPATHDLASTPIATLLAKVEDVFELTLRGLVIVPGPHVSNFERPCAIGVELHRPDGMRGVAVASLEATFSSPSPPAEEMRYACVLKGLAKSEVPRGTELWFLRPP